MLIFLVTTLIQLLLVGLVFIVGLFIVIALISRSHVPNIIVKASINCRKEKISSLNDLNLSNNLIDYKGYQESLQSSSSSSNNYFKTNLLISKNVDTLLEEIIDLIFRDYLYDWYIDLVQNNTDRLDVKLKNEIWTMFSRLLAICRQFDDISFLTKDLVTIMHSHVTKISLILSKQDSYELYDYLSTEEKEINYLNKLSNMILALLLPSRYAKSQPLVNLLKEILGIHVFHNCIEMISDPDYINQKIVEYIKNHLDESERHRKTYAYAKSYEEFVEMIKNCCSVEDLKKIRYRIVSEIMQATALENLKRQKLMDKELRPSQSTSSLAKGDLLLNRDLRRYINNLQYAKNLCSKRINYLITYAYPSISTLNPESVLVVDGLTYPKPLKKKILAFDIIIRSDLCRSFLRRFLQNSLGNSTDNTERTSKYLVLFWESVEEMRNQKGVKQYQIANELLKHSYFLNALNIHIKFGKNDRKGMESFIRGDKGPESFYEAQLAVYSVLVNRYYPLFIVSKEYDEMIDTHNDSDLFGQMIKCEENIENSSQLSLERSISGYENQSIRQQNAQQSVIDVHICQARTKLKELSKKIDGKQQALDAIKDDEHESNSKLAELLQKEIQDLREEMFELENHIVWSENWIINLNKWQAELHNIQLETQQSTSPLVIIIISSKEAKHEKSSADGWIIARTISDLIELKRKLVRINGNLKRIEILRLKNVAPTNVNLINRAKVNLQLFLDQLMRDENCVKSEEVYLFFCPSPGNLRVPLSFSKQFNFRNLPFASFFGITNPDSSESNSGKTGGDSDDEDEDDQSSFIFDDELESKDDNIAEPLYNLLTEIFELKGAMGFLRQMLIIFVHTTYGQTINKQLRETVSWTFSESMVHYYLTNLKNALWPEGKLAPPREPTNESTRRKNQFLAKRLLIDNIPDILNNLFGQQNCRKGLIKLFDYIQDQNLNKQLLYEILETFIIQFVPQLRETNSSSTTSSPTTTTTTNPS
ncbi:sorting nexin-25-like [Panonychus citri]|uniref:sorting nexin-25-like n=1 Tax=Panonychus citri TaxID=50023 RepID=UPI002306DD2B|nr:sorting nexin-25-like [Panonychus citri]